MGACVCVYVLRTVSTAATTTITTATTADTTTTIITTTPTTITTATVSKKEDKLSVSLFCVQNTLQGRDPYHLRTTREDGAVQTDRP